MYLRRVILAFLPALAGCIGQVADTSSIVSLPVSSGAEVFAPVSLPGTEREQLLERAGYEQREYLLSGTANRYRHAPGGDLMIADRPISFTTRLLIVRPRDPARFRGTVQLTFNHPSLASDNWDRFGEYAVQHGDAIAILQIGGDAARRADSTQDYPWATPLLFAWYDPVRYAKFHWPAEDGIRWDVIAQAAQTLRDPEGPLVDLPVKRLFVSGHSYLGAMIRTFIVEGFHDSTRMADGSPAIDGYLIQGSPRSGARGLQRLSESESSAQPDVRRLPDIDVPVIVLLSEHEAIYNRDPQKADEDAYEGGYRLYELGGVSHNDLGFAPPLTPVQQQLAARGHPGRPAFGNLPGELSDIPMRDITAAALANLESWKVTGLAPPKAARMQIANEDFERDAHGNPLGGIRIAQLEVPIARYAVVEGKCSGDFCFRTVRRFPLPSAELDRLYPGGMDEYLRRFGSRIDALVKERWLLPEAASRELGNARRRAAQIWRSDEDKCRDECNQD